MNTAYSAITSNISRTNKSLQQSCQVSFIPGMQTLFAEETFHKLNPEGVHLGRIYAGFNAFGDGHSKLKLYYAFEMRKSGISSTLNIIGMNWSIIL